MPYICVTDKDLRFDTLESLQAAQAAAVASGDVARMNTLFDLAWVEPTETEGL